MIDEIPSGDRSGSSLDPSAKEILRWGNAAVEAMAGYFDSIRDRRVYPDTNAREIRGKLDRALPEEGVSFDSLLATFSDLIVAASRHNGHPRMFGYVQAPGTAIAAISDLLASTLNANLTAWRSAPAAVEIERLTIDWIKEILGVDASAAGTARAAIISDVIKFSAAGQSGSFTLSLGPSQSYSDGSTRIEE